MTIKLHRGPASLNLYNVHILSVIVYIYIFIYYCSYYYYYYYLLVVLVFHLLLISDVLYIGINITSVILPGACERFFFFFVYYSNKSTVAWVCAYARCKYAHIHSPFFCTRVPFFRLVMTSFLLFEMRLPYTSR